MIDLDLRNQPLLPFLSCGLLSGILLAAPGCDPAIDFLEECGLTCPEEGVAMGNASISGIVSVDAFFSAVIDVRDTAVLVSDGVRAELEGMAASLDVQVDASWSIAQLSEAVVAGLQAKLEANINLDVGLAIKYEPPRCEASVEVAVDAAAECDVEASPGSIEAKCMGSCEVSADVAAECSAMGTLTCTGKAPMFKCDTPTCKGDCQLTVAAGCEGTCNGRCTGECSACTGGVCETNGMGEIINCVGSCSADCEGTCELEGGGMCNGRCEGECTYTPDAGVMCEAGATAKCDVSAMADVECQGQCEGSVEPPEVSAECQASVEAKAEASVECTPPSLTVNFEFAAGLDADAQADFKIWLEGFKVRFAGLLAATAKLDRVGIAATGLIDAAGTAVGDAFAQIEAEGGLTLKTGVGITCAITELDAVVTMLEDTVGEVQASVSASAMVTGSLAG
jgi:hypothetical protein